MYGLYEPSIMILTAVMTNNFDIFNHDLLCFIYTTLKYLIIQLNLKQCMHITFTSVVKYRRFLQTALDIDPNLQNIELESATTVGRP